MRKKCIFEISGKIVKAIKIWLLGKELKHSHFGLIEPDKEKLLETHTDKVIFLLDIPGDLSYL